MTILTICLAIAFGSVAKPDQLISGFSTTGHTVYHVLPATVAADGQRAIVSACYDGSVLCHTAGGQLLWKASTGGAFPFDLAVADVDGDRLEETFVASADGTLYAFDHDGAPLWQFSKEPPLYQVCVAKTGNGAPVVLAGGIERVLYALGPKGQIIAQRQFDRAVRVVRPGRFRGGQGEQVAVVTCHNGRDNFFLQLFDPITLEPQWEKDVDLSRSVKAGDRVRVFSVVACDLNGDGCDEAVMSLSTGRSASLAAFDGNGKRAAMRACKAGKARPYRMNLLTADSRPGPGGPRLWGLFGTELIAYGPDGSCQTVANAPYGFANLAFDARANELLLGSEISGGDGVYRLRVDSEGWKEAFANIQPVGRLVQVERNLTALATEAQQAVPPTYQPAPRPLLVILQQDPDEIRQAYKTQRSYPNLRFASYVHFMERYDPGIENPKWRAEFDRLHSGKATSQEEIIAFARAREAAGEDFVVWAGHGRIFGIDFYITLDTIEKLLKAAPTTLQGFVFAELEGLNDAMRQAVLTQLIPMAEMCRAHGGKKILLRNKNVFWTATCYHDVWREVLVTGKYKDIFVPSMEETNCRTQELSLMGRVGLWMTGLFDHVSARAVTDNATYSRCWEWGQQQVISHHLRALALQSSLGADILHVNLYQGTYDDLVPLFELLDKGLLRVPSREEVLSVSDLCLGMGLPSEGYLERATQGHNDSGYVAGQSDDLVFSKLDCFYGGTPVPQQDFTYYACGSRYRTLNFLPRMPYGLVAAVPDEVSLSEFPRFRRRVATDGERFYDESGQGHSAKSWQNAMISALEQAAKRLPVRVVGDVAWSAVRLDPTHIRVTLFDPGYLDPADREAKIDVRRLDGVTCRDILRARQLPVRNGFIRATVPAGSLCILDFAEAE